MGQRVQVIVRVPATYYNDKNPNNRPEQVFVYHNQWLYGIDLVQWTARFLSALRTRIAARQQLPTAFRLRWNGDWNPLSEAINYANHANLSAQTDTHLYLGNVQGHENDNQELAEAMSVREFLALWDNNNGYMFVEIADDLSVSYDLLTGREDDVHAPRSVSPQEYALQFADERELAEVEGFCEALAVIDGFARVDALAALTAIRERLRRSLRRRPCAA